MTDGGLLSSLAGELDKGHHGRGLQLYASLDGRPLIDWATGIDGLGNPVSTDTRFCVYCAAKPVVATTVGALVDAGEVSFDDLLGDVIDRPLAPSVAELTIAQLLDNTSGMHELLLPTFVFAPRGSEDEVIAASSPPTGWRVGQDVAYCEAAPWHYIAEVIELITGASLRSAVGALVTEPLGLSADLGVGALDGDVVDQAADRHLGVNASMCADVELPMLLELTRWQRTSRVPVLASWSNARSLGRFYEHLLTVVGGSVGIVTPQVLTELTSRHSHGDDPVMGRRCGYGLGFMTDVREHFFGTLWSQRSFGHAAFGGLTAAAADPSTNLVIAAHYTTRVATSTALEVRRPALLDRVARELLGVGAAMSGVPQPG